VGLTKGAGGGDVYPLLEEVAEGLAMPLFNGGSQSVKWEKVEGGRTVWGLGEGGIGACYVSKRGEGHGLLRGEGLAWYYQSDGSVLFREGLFLEKKGGGLSGDDGVVSEGERKDGGREVCTSCALHSNPWRKISESGEKQS